MFRSTLALAFALPVSMAVASPVSSSPRAASPATFEASARQVLETRFLANAAAGTALAITRLSVDELRMGHVRVQQTFRGVPVFQGEAIVHFNPDGSLFAVTDNLIRDVRLDVHPDIVAEEAIDLAMTADSRPGDYTSRPEVSLLVLARDNDARLTWRVQLRQEDGTEHTAMPVFFVDAHTGEIAWQYDNLQTATGSGKSLYSGTVSLETTKSGRYYYMEDLTRDIGTFDMKNRTSTVYRFSDTNNVWDSSSQQAGVDAHYGAAEVNEYYLTTFGRNGIDGNGGPGYYTSVDGSTALISSRVHYGRGYNNAYWSGSYMTYGDGDGSTFGSLVSLDICGHEMTHGVTQYTAGLTYAYESGALNESISDVFGTLVEFFAQPDSANWQIGEDAYTPGTSGDALRYMDNPHAAGDYGYTADDDPDHYSERYTGSSDNGGVHINSGIFNYTFYLLSEGGTHHLGGSMTGIGKETAGAIWYKALTEFMTSSTGFCGARQATMDAANALYGADSAELSAVDQAWTLTGVDVTLCGA